MLRRAGLVGLAALGCAGDPAREADRPFTAGLPRIDRIEVEVWESSPPAARLIVDGSLPDSCTALEPAEIDVVGNQIEVRLATRRPFGSVCPSGERSFRRSIRLPVSAAGGLYLLSVNGIADSFQVMPDPAARELEREP